MLHHKTFYSYEDYVRRQGLKVHANPEKFDEYNSRKIRAFKRLFKSSSSSLRPGPILCLGARAGWEVYGARRAGFKQSIGVDLHPISKVVMEADWHDLPFVDDSYDNIFTNSLDHCYSLPKLIVEIKRVLKPEGVLFLIVAERPSWANTTIDERMLRSPNEALFWNRANDVINEFEKHGFELFNMKSPKRYFLRLL